MIAFETPVTRKTVTDPALRTIVDGLVVAFIAAGNSVNAVNRRLSAVLDDGEPPIYPNRLHAILSDDPARSVNPQTLGAVARALRRLAPELRAEASLAAEPLRARVLAAWDACRSDDGEREEDATLRHVAERLALPPAVVRYVLRDANALGRPAAPLTEIRAAATHGGRSEPNWSFQDAAYRAALQALRAGPNRKVGLVVPTGGGKTRIAVRVLLRILADSARDDGVVLWLTHRRFLRRQARRELQRAINGGTSDLPQQAVRLLTERVVLTMISELPRQLEEYGDRVVLAVVDEAHHAAARTYEPLFTRPALRGLFLTATPNRTDAQSIGVDEIAYTITYRELFDRGVLVEPSFEEPLIVPDWSTPESVDDFADYVAERAQSEFEKTIVVAARVEHVEALHRALIEAFELRLRDGSHVLTADEVGFVHGTGSSTGAPPEEFLDEFVALPRGVLVTTAQMLGEGFDDPSVNAVVIAYPTSSMVQLMQLAGRCLRIAPGKRRAFVVQAKNSDLAYHFEQRWLYREISDTLRPQLVDRAYASNHDLGRQLDDLLGAHHVPRALREPVLRSARELEAGRTFSLLLSGLPFEGDSQRFSELSAWSAVPAGPAERDLFLRVYNDFSEAAGEIKFSRDFLLRYVDVDARPGSVWLGYRDMLHAMQYARREIDGESYWAADRRGYRANVGTTWLKFVTFRFDPVIPVALTVFLADVVNKEELLAAYADTPTACAACVKIDLPLGGALGSMLDPDQLSWLERERQTLVEVLRGVSPRETFGRLEAWRGSLPSTPLPLHVLMRFENVLSAESAGRHVLRLGAGGGGRSAPG